MPIASTRLLRTAAHVLCALCLMSLSGRVGSGQETYSTTPAGANGIPLETVAPPVVDTAKENKVKAVYLYSFGRFTRWPESTESKSDFTIAVVGSSGLSKNLGRIARKRKVQEKAIRVVQYDAVSEVDPAQCDILFITRSVSPSDAKKLLERLRSSDVMTVTDTSSRLPGAVVNFLLENNAVQFEINIEEAQRKRLSMDARLLRQGRRMQTESPSVGP